MPTEVTSWNFVNNGDTSYVNPESILNTSNINILNSKIQWKGSETSSTNSYYRYKSNRNVVTAQSESDTMTKTNSGGWATRLSASSFPPMSSFPDHYQFSHHILEIWTRTDGEGSTTLSWENINENWRSQGFSWNTTNYVNKYKSYTSSNYMGGGGHIWNARDDDDVDGFDVKVVAKTVATGITQDSATTSFPSVPSGYSFSRHRKRIEVNGSTTFNDYIYNNKVGQSDTVTANNGDTVKLIMKTRGKDRRYSTTYYDSNNPSVSGDVSASTSEDLGNNETSNWYNLSGLSSGSNALSHSVGGSNQVYYRVEFTWEYSVPASISEARVNINSTIYPVRLADPSDPALQYSSYRIEHPTEGTLAFDLVPTSDPDALPYRIYHPIHGTLALREKV